jgi:hypothetical protein
MHPNNKITFGPGHVRVYRLLKEIDEFKESEDDFFASRPGDLYYGA